MSDLANDAPDPRLARWERRATPFIIAAAIAPLVPTLTDADRDLVTVLVELVAWAVFLVDLAVHMRYRRGYLHTRTGVFDLVIVVGTFPWYLIPGLGGLAVLGLLRLARIGRILAIGLRTAPLRRLAQRLGAPAIVVLASVFVAGAIVWRAEPETFGSFENGVWWAFVTVTTVGYGDFTPVSGTGRVMAVLLMFVGVGLLGTVAASLASFLDELAAARKGAEADEEAGPSETVRVGELTAALESLRAEIAALRSERAARPDAEP